MIPKELIPITRRFERGATKDEILKFMSASQVDFPVILKPDIGERGWMVEKICDPDQLALYLKKIKVRFLLQEYVDYPLELGIFYVRYPGEKKGFLTSIVRKGFLSIKGNGKMTVSELLKENPRALLQFDFESDFYKPVLETIPEKEEAVTIEAIGNHCRGTTFFDDHNEIDQDLEDAIDAIIQRVPEFHFGRIDLRTTTYEDLKAGKNFKIMELNGAGSEPGHIYQPGFPILKAYRDVIKHLNLLSKVSILNKEAGTPYYSFKEGMRKIRDIRRYNRHKML